MYLALRRRSWLEETRLREVLWTKRVAQTINKTCFPCPRLSLALQRSLIGWKISRYFLNQSGVNSRLSSIRFPAIQAPDLLRFLIGL